MQRFMTGGSRFGRLVVEKGRVLVTVVGLAADAVVVTVQPRRVARIALIDWCGASGAGFSAVPEWPRAGDDRPRPRDFIAPVIGFAANPVVVAS